ncbi:MAG TPA: biopolymer transporter ExbD [Polyangia bacterium]|jgi:biopolymer transport protein ExbD
MGMNVGGGGGSKTVAPNVNMTPLIDIVLVLLIIFMVLTPQMLKELAVNVPKKADEQIQADVASDQLIITYGPDRKILLNNEPIAQLVQVTGGSHPTYDTGNFATRMRDELAKRRTKVVFFNVEDDSNYGEVVRVMDVCRGAGVKTLGIMTKD